LEATIGAMQARLARAPEAIRNAWENYLRLDELVASFEQPIERQLEQLEALRKRLSVDVEGLEDEEPAALRAAANAYSIALRLSRIDLKMMFERDLDLLSTDLAEYARRPTQELSDRIGTVVGRLEAAEQAPELIAEVRRRWSQPNVVVFLKSEFLNGYLPHDIAESRFQTANILGTHTSGMARTDGRLEVATLDNPDQAEFQLRLNGTTKSDRSIGRNGPATILSSSFSRFELTKNVRFDPERILVVDPAVARCSSNINIRDIDVDTRLLPAVTKPAAERVAWNKAREQQSAVEHEVARLVGRRLDEGLNGRLAEPLEMVRKYYKAYLVDRPSRYDEAPAISSRSTAEGAFFELRQARPHQLGAPAAPPAFEPATQFGVAMHQSAFNNASSRSIFGGGLQTDEQIEHYAQMMGGGVPAGLRVFSSSVPWSVCVDVERPNTIIFDDGKIDLTIHTTTWTIGERRFDRAVNLKVTYELGNSPLGMTFTRVGSGRIEPVDARPWSGDEATILMPHIEAKFAAAFPESGRFNVLIMPKGDAFGPLGNADTKQVTCDDGWVLIGYH
jgi:hypothetical protein